MKRTFTALACAFMVWSVAPAALADHDFKGIIESRPDGNIGTWRVGGRSVEVTENTRLDEDDGPLKVGACAEVDKEEPDIMEFGGVVEISSEPLSECGK